MTSTEADVRRVYRDRVPDDVVDDLERRLRASIDTPSRRGHSRLRWLATTAAAAAVVALAVGLGAMVGDAPPPHRSASHTGRHAAVELAFAARVDAGSAYRTTFHSVTADRELIGLHLVNAPNVRCACSQTNSTTLISVYRRGFDPRSLRQRHATSVDGRRAWTGTLPVGPVDAMTGLGDQAAHTLAFQYAPGSWATVQGRTSETARAARLRALATALRVGDPLPLRVPLRFTHPHGLHVLSFTRWTRGEGQPGPNSMIVLSSGPSYGSTPSDRALLLDLIQNSAQARFLVGDDARQPIPGAHHDGRIAADAASARTPDATFRVGSGLVFLSGQGLRGHPFLDLVRHVSWPARVTADQRTWFPASEVTSQR